MAVEDMARFALAILWGSALCGGIALAATFWLHVIIATDHYQREVAFLAAFFLTILSVVGVFWTLSASDLFHFWSWARGK